jgi:Winged helix DNA-binding domain
MTPVRKRRRDSTPTAAAFSAPPPITLSTAAARLLRLRGSRLVAPTVHTGPLAALAAVLLGIQAQEPGAAALALHVRLSSPPSRATLLAAFSTATASSRLVRVHGARGTLHVYDAAKSWPVVCAACGPRVLATRARSVGAAELDAAVATLRARLEAGRTVTAADLPEAEFPLRYSAMMAVAYTGCGARVNVAGGTVVAPRATVVAPEDAEWEELAEGEAVVRAARVYFAAFAPATEADFRYYLGITAAASCAAVKRLEADGELVRVVVEAGAGADAFDIALAGERLVSRGCVGALQELETAPDESIPKVVVLGKFDVLTLGHAEKAWLVPPAMKGRVWSSNADVRALLLLRGRAVAIWRGEVLGGSGNRDGKNAKRLEVVVEVFEGIRLRRAERDAVVERFRDIARQFFEVSGADVKFRARE